MGSMSNIQLFKGKLFGACHQVCIINKNSLNIYTISTFFFIIFIYLKKTFRTPQSATHIMHALGSKNVKL